MCGRVAAEITSRSNLSALQINFGFALPLIINTGIVFYSSTMPVQFDKISNPEASRDQRLNNKIFVLFANQFSAIEVLVR
jgi:hypothetical protein